MFFKRLFKKKAKVEEQVLEKTVCGEEPIFCMPLTETITRSVCLGDDCFVLQEYRRYEKRAELDISYTETDADGFMRSHTEKIEIPYSEDEKLMPFTIKGHELYWDYRDNTFRYNPEVDFSKKMEINPWFYLLGGEALWVEKQFAEDNLTPECLSYACGEENGGYIWNDADYSAYALYMELFDVIAEHEKMSEDVRYRKWIDVLNFASTYDNFHFEKFTNSAK